MAREITVVGAGLAGTLAALLLAQRGHAVTLFERRRDPRVGASEAGRSINLALSFRGLEALRRVGLAERARAASLPMRGRRIHPRGGGAEAFQPYGTEEDHAIRSIGRAELNTLLVEAAAAAGVTIHFEHRLLDLEVEGAGPSLPGQTDDGEREAPRVRLAFAAGPEGGRVEVTAGAVLGADGAFSAVRARLQRTDRFTYEQRYLEHGYKELAIPPCQDGAHALAPDGLHIWPRDDFMLIALPNLDGSFTGTLFMAHEGSAASFAAVRTAGDAEAFFRQHFPDAAALIPDLGARFVENPTGSLVTIRCFPWHVGPVGLLGDACHAVVPFYGQGMNAAFEDCLVLDQVLDELGGFATANGAGADWPLVFRAFERRRKPDADALADLAIHNYLEMRQKTASTLFLLHKRAEKALHRLLGARFLPLYTMVTFTRIPYAEALARDRLQQRALWVLAGLAGVLALGAAAGLGAALGG